MPRGVREADPQTRKTKFGPTFCENRYWSTNYQYVTISGVHTGDYHNTPQRQSIYEFRIEMQEQNFRDMTGGSAFQEIQEENFKDMKGGSALRIKEVRFFLSRVRLDSRYKSMSFEESRHN